MRARVSAGLLMWAVTFGAGCASTKVTSSWKEPEAVGTTEFQKVLVIAVIPQESIRRNLEANLAAELRKQGMDASRSSEFIEDGSTLTRERVRALVGDRGFDAVLVTQYLGTERELDYVPPTYDTYVGYTAPHVYSAGYMDEHSEVKLETRFFDARAGGRLLWSASTSTVDPSSAEKEVPRVAEVIVARLEKDMRM